MEANAIPDTVSYLYLGLAAVSVFMGSFIVSLYVRYRKAASELASLQDKP